MQAIIIISGRIIVVVSAFLACLALIGVLLTPEPQTVPVRDNSATFLSQQTVWSSIPIRVDRSKQVIEPLIDPYSFKFRGRFNMRIYDSGSFLLNDDILILEGIVPLPPRQICTDAAGKKSACGARSIQALRRALSGKFVECSRKPLALHVYLVDCTVNGKRIAETLLQQGAGHAAR